MMYQTSNDNTSGCSYTHLQTALWLNPIHSSVYQSVPVNFYVLLQTRMFSNDSVIWTFNTIIVKAMKCHRKCSVPDLTISQCEKSATVAACQRYAFDSVYLQYKLASDRCYDNDRWRGINTLITMLVLYLLGHFRLIHPRIEQKIHTFRCLPAFRDCFRSQQLHNFWHNNSSSGRYNLTRHTKQDQYCSVILKSLGSTHESKRTEVDTAIPIPTDPMSI